MNIEIRPRPRSFMESELLVGGEVVGEIEVEGDGRISARLILRDESFLGGIHSSIFGHGDTYGQAVLDALDVGRRQYTAMGAALAELESRVLVTAS